MFSWDINKALSNFKKHGVSFGEATSVFVDQFGLELDASKHLGTERRIARFGMSSLGRILTVIFTIRKDTDGQETIRIISARHASRKERENYTRFRDRL